MGDTTTKTTTGSQSYKVHNELGSYVYGPHISGGKGDAFALHDEYTVYDDNLKPVSSHKDLTEAKKALSKHLIDTGHKPAGEEDILKAESDVVNHPIDSLMKIFGK